jgi:hypothetical protein
MMKMWNKNTGPDFKQKYKSRISFLLKKSRTPVSMNFFFKVNNMKYWHPHLPFGQPISVPTLVYLKKKY